MADYRDLIAESLGVYRDRMTEDVLLKEDLGADSLDIVELWMKLEDEYDIEIGDADGDRVKTVGDVRKLLIDKGVDVA